MGKGSAKQRTCEIISSSITYYILYSIIIGYSLHVTLCLITSQCLAHRVSCHTHHVCHTHNAIRSILTYMISNDVYQTSNYITINYVISYLITHIFPHCALYRIITRNTISCTLNFVMSNGIICVASAH